MNTDRKYQLPPFLKGKLTQPKYETWLTRKAATHRKRDRNRTSVKSTLEEYKIAIHNAVKGSKGKDEYTGKPLRWRLVSTYNNDDSKKNGSRYKAIFGELPTVDHVSVGKKKLEFKICSWKVNDAKNDLSLKDFVALCRKVVQYYEKRG